MDKIMKMTKMKKYKVLNKMPMQEQGKHFGKIEVAENSWQ